MDTTTHAFDSVFATEYSKADAVVVGSSPISGASATAPPVSAAVAARIRALPQVADVQGFVDDTRAQLRTAHGGAISGVVRCVVGGARGAQRVLRHSGRRPGSVRPGRARSRSMSRRPRTTIFASARPSGLVSLHPLQWFRVVGIVRYGGVGSLGPIRLVVLDLPVAQQLFNKQGLYDQIYVSVSSRG